MQDFRSALRLFVRAPLAAAVVVVSLGLGIGANTAVFSSVDAIQFKALPFVDEGRLVNVHEWSATELCAGCGVGSFGIRHSASCSPSPSRLTLAAYVEGRYAVSGGEGPERVGGAAVTADLFSTLGVQPSVGRGFTGEDERDNATPTVVIGDLLVEA